MSFMRPSIPKLQDIHNVPQFFEVIHNPTKCEPAIRAWKREIAAIAGETLPMAHTHLTHCFLCINQAYSDELLPEDADKLLELLDAMQKSADQMLKRALKKYNLTAAQVQEILEDLENHTYVAMDIRAIYSLNQDIGRLIERIENRPPAGPPPILRH